MNARQTVCRLFVVRLVCIAVVFGAALGGIYRTSVSSAAPNAKVIAIDVLLVPEAALVRYSRGVNAELRREYPRGYALDVFHNPHITLVQRYVRSSSIRAISEAVAQVVEEERPTTMQLTANGYRSRDWDGMGVMELVVDVSPRLRNFEQRIVDAVQPFAVSGGTADAFAVPAGGIAVNQDAIDWVENFVPAFTGKRFAVFLPLGVAPTPFLSAIKAKPFEHFTFGIDEVAIYQLGQYATPQARLWESNVEPCPGPCSD